MCYVRTVRSKNSPGGRTFADEARRTQLVDCAIEVIAEEGYAQASLSRIAQRAGVAKSVVLYHFAGKDELVEQVLTAVSLASVELLPARMAAATGTRAKLRAALASLAEWMAAHPVHNLAALETWNQTRSLPARARLAADPAGANVEDIRLLVEAAQRAGEVPAAVNPHVIAVMFRQAVDAISLELALDPDGDLPAFAAGLGDLFDRALS
jgi:TetR/AcrR family transcriptional regulator, fatty acid metabolism regulator protein